MAGRDTLRKTIRTIVANRILCAPRIEETVIFSWYRYFVRKYAKSNNQQIKSFVFATKI